jgi:hypothetical protein
MQEPVYIDHLMRLGPRGNQIVAHAIANSLGNLPSNSTKRNSPFSPHGNVLFTAFSVRRISRGMSNFHWRFHFTFSHVSRNLLKRSDFSFLGHLWWRDCTFNGG